MKTRKIIAASALLFLIVCLCTTGCSKKNEGNSAEVTNDSTEVIVQIDTLVAETANVTTIVANNEKTKQMSIDWRGGDIVILKEDCYQIYVISPKASWYTVKTVGEQITVHFEKNNFSKNRELSLLCAAEGKENINYRFTQKMYTKSGYCSPVSGIGKSVDYIERYISEVPSATLPTSILVRSGSVIDAVGFKYGSKSFMFGGSGGDLHEIKLDADEYIVEVSGRYTDSYRLDGYVLTGITFTTNKKSHTFTGDRSDIHDWSYRYRAKPGNAIFCLYGVLSSSDRYVRSLGFYESAY
ncbi:hypothetical protein LJB80_01095 [Bacteroides sp. OttesenSCG-928-F21]|nr:hypothetical protein [Bacteroides sp. OttesenSCG-928-F21]